MKYATRTERAEDLTVNGAEVASFTLAPLMINLEQVTLVATNYLRAFLANGSLLLVLIELGGQSRRGMLGLNCPAQHLADRHSVCLYRQQRLKRRAGAGVCPIKFARRWAGDVTRAWSLRLARLQHQRQPRHQRNHATGEQKRRFDVIALGNRTADGHADTEAGDDKGG